MVTTLQEILLQKVQVAQIRKNPDFRRHENEAEGAS